jgi:hypothetical protein
MRKIEGYDIQYDFSGFKKMADLITFDGPLLSHYVSPKGDDYLFYWVDRDSQDNRWLVLRVSLASLQKYIGKKITLLELIENPNDGYLYSVDVDNNIQYHNVKLVQSSAIPWSPRVDEGSAPFFCACCNFFWGECVGIRENVVSLHAKACETAHT